MAGNFIPINIGSGLQDFRITNLGRHNHLSQLVAITNFEDQVAVHSWETSGIAVPTSGPTLIAPKAYRRVIAINNEGGSRLYIGPTSGVTPLNGYPVAVGTEKAFSIGANLEMWIIASGIDGFVKILQIA